MSIFKKNKKYDYNEKTDGFGSNTVGMDSGNYPTSPSADYKSCTTCGCLIASDRTQVVYVSDRSESYPNNKHEYYCVIHALPYDWKFIMCKHETHFYQTSTVGADVEVRENGKPLPKAKV